MADSVEIKEEVKKEQTQVVVAQPTNMVATLDNGIFSSSDTWKLSCQMAKGLASSTIVPQAYQRNEGNCIVALELANRLGISPLQVMQSLDVIQGTPAWRGKALIAFVNNSHKYDEDIHFEYEYDDKGNPISCYAWTKKDGSVVKGTPFTMETAKSNGLLAKNNSYWLKEPALMLAYRAISRFCSLNCPEISMGLYTREEVLDMNEIPQETTKKKASLNELLDDETQDTIEVVNGEVI